VIGGSTTWLTGFQWRKSHVINGSSYGALTDYCVRIDVYRSTGTDNGRDVYVGEFCKPDFGDIRFTNNVSQELDYFLYNQTSAHAQFWVEIDSIPAYPSNATIYLYFGNNTASTTSNAQASSVFGHGDDFNDESMNVTLWELYKQSDAAHGTAIENPDGMLHCRSAVGNAVGYVSVNRYILSDLEISMYVNVQTEWANDIVISSIHDNDYPNPENNGNNYVIKYDNVTDKFIVYRRLSGSKTVRFQQTWNRSTGDEYLRMRIYDGNIKFIEGEYERYSESWALPTTNMFFYPFSNVDNTDGLKSNLIDNFFIRTYVEPEPNHFAAWGFTETNADWAFTDYDYRKHLTLVSYDDNLTDYTARVITHAGDETLSTHGFLGNNTPNDNHTYPIICAAFGGLYTPNASGYINQVSLHVEQMGTDYPDIVVAVYSNTLNDSNNQPMRALAVGNGTWTVTAGFDGWRTWELNKTLDVGPNMEYWLIGWQRNTTKKYEGAQYNYTGTLVTIQSMNWSEFPNWPDVWTYSDPPDQIGEQDFMFYANLTSETKDDTREVYLNNHAQNDFDDVRFTYVKSDYNQVPLNYWIDPALLFNGDNATFYVKVPAIYNESVTYCWMYYGNEIVGNVSSGVDTFTFFDDFDSSDEPPDGWSETQVGSSTWSDISENSYYKVYNYQDDSSQWHGNELDRSVSPATPTKWLIEWRTALNNSVNDHPQSTFWIRLYDGATEKVRLGYDDNWIAFEGEMYSWITGTAAGEGADTRNVEANYNFTIRSDGTTIKTWWNGTLRQSKAATDTFDTIKIRLVAGGANDADNPRGSTLLLLLRQWVETEPTYAWSPEGLHSVQVTYYFNAGGVFRVNGTNVVNGSMAEIYYLSSVDLGALGNTTMLFNNFTITNLETLTTGVNPYLYNFSSDDTTAIWCRWIAPTAAIRYDMFFGGLMLIACIAGLLGYTARKKRF